MNIDHHPSMGEEARCPDTKRPHSPSARADGKGAKKEQATTIRIRRRSCPPTPPAVAEKLTRPSSLAVLTHARTPIAIRTHLLSPLAARSPSACPPARALCCRPCCALFSSPLGLESGRLDGRQQEFHQHGGRRWRWCIWHGPAPVPRWRAFGRSSADLRLVRDTADSNRRPPADDDWVGAQATAHQPRRVGCHPGVTRTDGVAHLPTSSTAAAAAGIPAHAADQLDQHPTTGRRQHADATGRRFQPRRPGSVVDRNLFRSQSPEASHTSSCRCATSSGTLGRSRLVSYSL